MADQDISQKIQKAVNMSNDEPKKHFETSLKDTVMPWQAWQRIGTNVTDTKSILSVETNKTDSGGVAVSPAITIDPTKVIVFERRARVVPGSNWTSIGVSLVFSETPDFLTTLSYGMKPNGVFITYAKYEYSDQQMRPANGVYLGNGSAEIRSSAISQPGIIPWGSWFFEKLMYNPVTGDASLWINNTLIATKNVGKNPATKRYMKIYIDAYGWYTGHSNDTESVSASQILY